MQIKEERICIISPSLKLGGVERALVVLADYFTFRGFKVTFLSCLAGHQFYKLDNRIELIEPKFKHFGKLMGKIVFYARLLCFINRSVISINPNIVIAFGDWFSPLVLLALYKTNYPVYISDRTSPDYRFRFPIPILKMTLYPRSAGFIAQTQRAAEYKRKQFSNRLNIRVIPNAIREVKSYDVLREKIILYVGRFAWEKGPERLIRAFAAIEDRKGWKLLMAGSGPLLKPMQELAKQMNLVNDINFLGKVEDVDHLYSKAGIYVLPSVLEGFPNSLCEAMAAGLPVVCFDSIPWEEILEPGESGLLVKNNDIECLTDTLQELIKNKYLREYLGQNALSIKNRLSVENIGSQVVEFIFPKLICTT